LAFSFRYSQLSYSVYQFSLFSSVHVAFHLAVLQTKLVSFA